MKWTCLFIAFRFLGTIYRLYATVIRSGEVFFSAENIKASYLSIGFQSRMHALWHVTSQNFYLKITFIQKMKKKIRLHISTDCMQNTYEYTKYQKAYATSDKEVQ